MTFIPLTEAAGLLAVDAKTLRKFLKHSDLSLQAHPTDGRIKCLTPEQVQQLATLHGRPMNTASASEPPPTSASSVQNAPMALQLQPVSAFPSSSSADSDLISRLASLEATVSTLQQQVTQLALELLNARERTIEHRLCTLEAQISPSSEPSSSKSLADICPEIRPFPAWWHPNRAELRAHSRIVPLIEYDARGTYVIIHPQEGELFLTPDSQQWFDWLASLNSFRFVGPRGRFNAYRESHRGKTTRSWSAHRHFHGHQYKHYLGVTDTLTLSCLEQMAARLQSYVTASN